MFEIGNSLREARVRRGVEFAQAELGTKIRGKYLRALEEEHFEVLPAQTYVKGFLRTYAEYLGLDGQLYVDEYNSRFVAGDEQEPHIVRRSAARPQRRNRRIETNVVLVALALIAIITVVVISAWKTSGSSPHVAKQAAPPTQTRAHVTAAAAHAASAPAVRHVTRHVAALPSQPLRPRARLSVLVLNGNGVKGAAGAKAVSLQTLGYGSSHSENAPRHDYARSMVMYLPGYAQEARRLGRDAGVRIVATLDGMRRAQLKGSQLVVVLGGS